MFETITVVYWLENAYSYSSCSDSISGKIHVPHSLRVSNSTFLHCSSVETHPKHRSHFAHLMFNHAYGFRVRLELWPSLKPLATPIVRLLRQGLLNQCLGNHLLHSHPVQFISFHCERVSSNKLFSYSCNYSQDSIRCVVSSVIVWCSLVTCCSFHLFWFRWLKRFT